MRSPYAGGQESQKQETGDRDRPLEGSQIRCQIAEEEIVEVNKEEFLIYEKLSHPDPVRGLLVFAVLVNQIHIQLIGLRDTG